ncbi:MAG TPA: transporter, partial [Acidocella sp.]|nr:transporter [Acidocella sp.]
MSNCGKHLRASLFGAVLPLAACLGGHAAFASDPLPGDGIAPPVNVNIGMFYNEFTSANEIGALHGTSYDHSTRIPTNISVARYIRTFDVAGFLSGAQIYEPYVAFIGSDEAGISNIPGPYVPALGGQLPSYGAGHANLSHNGGFGQPNIGLFSYLINNPATGTYGVVAPWIAPPVSSFNKNYSLNPAQNVWTYELELGFRTTLLGTPTTRNLSIELWSETYLFGANNNSAYVSPAVYANNIPSIYSVYHVLSGGLIPDSNPLQTASATPASFHEQPSQEIRVYLPYEFAPSMGAFIAPGFYQSFGGKQT